MHGQSGIRAVSPINRWGQSNGARSRRIVETFGVRVIDDPMPRLGSVPPFARKDAWLNRLFKTGAADGPRRGSNTETGQGTPKVRIERPEVRLAAILIHGEPCAIVAHPGNYRDAGGTASAALVALLNVPKGQRFFVNEEPVFVRGLPLKPIFFHFPDSDFSKLLVESFLFNFTIVRDDRVITFDIGPTLLDALA